MGVRGAWPLFDLRIEAADVELRPMTESDLEFVSDLLPDDVEIDPMSITYPGYGERMKRSLSVHQGYWKSFGSWSPEAWRLGFVVINQSRMIGFQELEGNDFLRLRTVDSASFLVPEFRGRGLGRQMREAVLTLAFGPLNAEAAITESWHDNYASLGVSQSLGYRPNGEGMHRRGEGADVMIHLRLVRSDWIVQGRGEQVKISGFDACRPLFGLAGDQRADRIVK